MSLLVVGTVAFDSIHTPYGRAENVIGGAATYICWAASYFYDRLHLVSVVGDDFPTSELKTLEQRGVDMSGLQIKPGEKSFFWAGKYRPDMNNRDTLTTDLNVLASFDPILPESFRSPEFVMLGNLTPAVQLKVLDQLLSTPRLVVLDTMNFWMDTALEGLKEVLARVDVLTINDEEARQLSGELSLVRAAEVIHQMGPRTLIIKKGEHGALLFQGGRIFFAPGFPLEEIYDPTGAGDTFAGGFIGYLASTRDVSFENMRRAVVFGSALASFCVEAFSLDRIKTVSNQELKERVHQFTELVRFDVDLGESEPG